MRNDTMYKTRLALACGALLALGLAGCNREKEQMATEPAASATAVTEPMPPPPMTPAEPMTPAVPMTPATPMTASMPPAATTATTGEVIQDEVDKPMESTTQPADDAGAPPTR